MLISLRTKQGRVDFKNQVVASANQIYNKGQYYANDIYYNGGQETKNRLGEAYEYAKNMNAYDWGQFYGNMEGEVALGAVSGGAGNAALKGSQTIKIVNKVIPNSPESLYHYTNEKGMKGILSSKEIYPSIKAKNPSDAIYGDGVYLSDIKPGTYSNGSLAARFLRTFPNPNIFTHYVEIDVTGLNASLVKKRGTTNIYLIETDVNLDISDRILNFGEN